jgi:hypothetical protein
MARILVKVTRGLVLFVAWFFFLFSILGAWVLGVMVAWPGGIDSTELLGLTYHVGLAYEGRAGALLAVGEAVAVATCLLLSRAPRATLRRIGHLGLLAWVSLFLGNALCSFDAGDAMVLGVVATLAAIWLCVLLRAVWFWTPPTSGAPRPRPGSTP